VGGIARRLDRDCAPIDLRRQYTFGLKLIEHLVEERGISGVKAQFGSPNLESAASSARVPPRHHRGPEIGSVPF
jgi:hypothetical protein